MSHRIVTAVQRPDLAGRMNAFTGTAWPEFMKHDTISDLYWARLYPEFADYQFGMIDEHENILAVGNSVPISWTRSFEELPDTGWDWEVETAFSQRDAGLPPTTLCAVQIVIDTKYRGAGLSRAMVIAMRGIAAEHGANALIAPVRPTQKYLYPLTPMSQYIGWKRPDGSLFDAWLRVHELLGAALVKVAPRAMKIPGSIAEWEKWTGISFPESGEYVVPFALNPISIDRDSDRGIYIEPNVWMVHSIDGKSAGASRDEQ